MSVEWIAKCKFWERNWRGGSHSARGIGESFLSERRTFCLVVAVCLLSLRCLDFLSCQGRLTRQISIISSLKISKHRISVFSLPVLVWLKLIPCCYFREKYLKICFTSIYFISNVKKTHNVAYWLCYWVTLSLHPWLPKAAWQLLTDPDCFPALEVPDLPFHSSLCGWPSFPFPEKNGVPPILVHWTLKLSSFVLTPFLVLWRFYYFSLAHSHLLQTLLRKWPLVYLVLSLTLFPVNFQLSPSLLSESNHCLEDSNLWICFSFSEPLLLCLLWLFLNFLLELRISLFSRSLLSLDISVSFISTPDNKIFSVLQVLATMERLEKVNSFQEFVQIFSQFGNEMVEFAHLTGDRQNVCIDHI